MCFHSLNRFIYLICCLNPVHVIPSLIMRLLKLGRQIVDVTADDAPSVGSGVCLLV